MEFIIKCRNLTHRYGKRLIYDKLSFGVPRGKILGLLENNGTGKTTAINFLSGFLEPEAGECLIFGKDIREILTSLQTMFINKAIFLKNGLRPAVFYVSSACFTEVSQAIV